MPRIVKGGKYVYGWSEVGSDGRVTVPDEALTEYNFKTPSKAIWIPGSKRSGGFTLTTANMQKSEFDKTLARRLTQHQVKKIN